MSVKIAFILALSFLFVACKDENPPVKKPKKETHSDGAVPGETNIEVLFNETSFQDEKSTDLLKELGYGMCNPKETDMENYTNPPCSPKFFKFFTYKKDTKLENAFVMLIKARVHDFPLRRVFVFQREQGKLVKVNGFVADLIGKRKSATEYEDLILRFSDQDQNHFNCLYTWKNKRYEYVGVEQINDSNVKDIYQDSMNVEIYKVIEQNRMQF